MRKRNATSPDTLIIWDIPWTREGEVWVGPAITDPEDPMLATAVAYQRIVRWDGRSVMVDPSITLDRFGWDEDDLTIHDPEEEVRSVSLKPESQGLWGIGSLDRTIFDNCISVQVPFLPPRCRADSVASGVATDPQSPKRG